MSTMSMEAALDEERREVMEMLEGRSKKTESPSRRQPLADSPVPPVRSMLDVSSGPIPRHGSIAGIGVGITAGASPTQAPAVWSMLDPMGSGDSASHRAASSSNAPPNSAQVPTIDRSRRSSDAAKQLPQGLPRVGDGSKKDLNQDYQFGMLPSIANQALPKRVTQGGRKPKDGSGSTAMAAAISGDFSTLPGFARTKEGRHNSTVGIGAKSRSPSSRIFPRSQSPGSNLLSANSPNPGSGANTYVTGSGKVIDMDKAYRKLSNRSGNSFSTVNSGESDEIARVQKDPIADDGDEGALESSEEEDEPSTDEEDWKSEASRGRRRSRRKKGSMGSEGDGDENEGASESMLGMGKAQGPRQVKSLLAAAEEERKTVSSSYQVKSLLEPEISVTGPSGEKVLPKKAGVHPNTNFDHPASGATSANSSENDGDISDIKRAQKLSINMSPIDGKTPNRVIRTILRGDFASMQEEIEDGRRRERTYLVATDLSDEAVYALEWTIGTILRDGDTLLAMYAIDEEMTNSKSVDVEHKEGPLWEETKAAHDTVQSMVSQTERAKQHPVTVHLESVSTLSAYVPATETTSLTGSVDSRMMSKAELERCHAIEDISSTCIRLLRKTRLQVRVTIEVLHCKSPKHMITEAIDVIDPTLVILGSRGRSALKGVLLGSFSNYLVTKSSVPVMVARKKLKKHAKMKSTKIRLSNNLTTPGSPRRLSTAKVD